MDSLITSIEILFKNNQPQKKLSDYFRIIKLVNINDNDFIKLGFGANENFSLDEINNLWSKLQEDWFFDTDNNKTKSEFNLLQHFNKQVITEIDLQPFVNYEHLLRWRKLSFSLGEDLFTTANFAYLDTKSFRKRYFFAWRPVAFTTNNRLKKLLEDGMAENHFHLKGSAPLFEISWIALMNKITGNYKKFVLLENDIKLNGIKSHSFSMDNDQLEVLVYKAAFIRMHLFKCVNEIENSLNSKVLEDLSFYLSYPANKSDSINLIINLDKIQQEINALKLIFGFSFPSGEIADYAIPKNIHDQNFKGSFILTGERKFLYDCFKLIYSQNSTFSNYVPLFHSYLLIKSRFREELIQINKRVGFSNFLKYQDRKEWFVPKESLYEDALIHMAITDSLNFQNIKSFETRITPKNTASEIHSSISKIKKIVTKKLNNSNSDIFVKSIVKENTTNKNAKYFHVLHFIKEKDTIQSNYENSTELEKLITIPRHHQLRKKLKVQARAIMEYRDSFLPDSAIVKGIDAASSEFDARPEVFAVAYRYLKNHKILGRYNHLKSEIKEPRLFATFHAGEDYYDIIDGLRTIDEAIQFLNLSQGDRIGHGIVLGIDAKEYYDFKGKKILLPKEILLDNIVWLLSKARKFGITNFDSELNKLEKLYNGLFREIYSDHFLLPEDKKRHFPYSVFYDSWKLRGDDPELYLEDYCINPANKNINQELTYWGRCKINHRYPTSNNIRKSHDVRFLYNQYHYNVDIKKYGKKIKEFFITDSYIKLVREIQTNYMATIKSLNLGIECNPTSNYLISTFDKYSKHPIINFYNLGLETDPEKIKNCPQLFVSINTDDQGIFGTSLENEFALMAIALEKEKDENGKPKYNPTMIYNWLDNIRRMGLEQSFDVD